MVCSNVRNRLEPLALAFLRIFTGVVMATHGWQKIQTFEATLQNFTSMGMPMPKIMLILAIGGEFLGGLGLIVGLLTPIAAFGVFAVMAVAVFKVHFANGLLAKDGGFEYPGTLMFVAFYFMIRGAGALSLDALFCRKKPEGSLP